MLESLVVKKELWQGELFPGNKVVKAIAGRICKTSHF